MRRQVVELVAKLIEIHEALKKADYPHAVGGAVALGYCIEEPRGTRDLDINIFVDATRAGEVLAALPSGVTVSAMDVETVRREGQTRLDWDGTPIDVFLSNHPFHELVASRVRWVPLANRQIPALDCASLVVFKALFNRMKDWADIEEIAKADEAGVQQAIEWLRDLTGDDEDETIARLQRVIS